MITTMFGRLAAVTWMPASCGRMGATSMAAPAISARPSTQLV